MSKLLALDIILFFALIPQVIALGPIFYKWIREFLEAETEAFFSKRRPALIKALLLSLIVAAVFANPLTQAMYSPNLINWNAPLTILIDTILDHVVYVGCAYIGWIMVWLIRYDIHRAIAQQQNQWAVYLNDLTHLRNWYAANRRSWGSLKWLAKRFTVFWIFCGLIKICLVLLRKHSVARDIFFAELTLIVLSLSVVWWKTPPFEDAFFIRSQTRWLLRWSVLGIGFHVFLQYGLTVFMPVNHFVRVFMGNTIVNVSLIVSVWILIRYPLWVAFSRSSPRKLPQLVANSSVSGPPPKFSLPPLRRSNTGIVKLHDVLSNEKSFQSFMQHLMKEFSFENLLFLIEVTHLHRVFCDGQTRIRDLIDLPPNVPASALVSDMSTNFREKCEKLYLKYVHESKSILMINVSGNVRHKMELLFENPLESVNDEDGLSSVVVDSPVGSPKGRKEIWKCLDAAYTEIISLLTDSLCRYDCV